ncbi:MAG: hypothetical protein JWP42_2197 [Pseudomonas sp.]|nr:hypothetical protein [Pseudomonas sp.]
MKRDIFSELNDGLEALAEERQGQLTLRSHKVKLPKLSLPEDFDAPLPEDVLDDFEACKFAALDGVNIHC